MYRVFEIKGEVPDQNNFSNIRGFSANTKVWCYINITNEDNPLNQGIHNFSKNLGATLKF